MKDENILTLKISRSTVLQYCSIILYYNKKKIIKNKLLLISIALQYKDGYPSYRGMHGLVVEIINLIIFINVTVQVKLKRQNFFKIYFCRLESEP